MANQIISEGNSVVLHLSKQCTRCKQTKLLECFGLNNKNRDGRKSWCKFCLVDAERVRRNSNIEYYRAKEVERRLLNLERRRESERKADAKRRTKHEFYIKSRERSRNYAISEHKKRAKEVTCIHCHSVYCPVFGVQNRHPICPTCSPIRNVIRLRTKASAYKARKRNAKIESVDPIKVFERDKWKCKCCGVKTKPVDRGTFKPRAPELDHIVPLSVGGEHSYRNTQLLCRTCNIKKHNNSANDQMLLFG